MKPVSQLPSRPVGCFAACVSSILRIPLESIPEGFDGKDKWDPIAQRKFLAAYGYGIVEHVLTLGVPRIPASDGIWCSLAGPSPRNPGGLHAVVAKSRLDTVDPYELVHDPHPDGNFFNGLPAVSVTYFVPLPGEPFQKYYGAKWFANSQKKTLNPFQTLVMDIIGQVWRGIYHQDHGLMDLWELGDRHVRIFVPEDLATYDGIELTALVGLAHMFAVRVDISAKCVVYESEVDDSESHQPVGITRGVCAGGYNDDGHDIEDFEKEVDNEDFDPDIPEDPKINPRRIEKEMTRSANACLEIMFHPRKHGAASNFERHLTLAGLVAFSEALGHHIPAPVETKPGDYSTGDG